MIHIDMRTPIVTELDRTWIIETKRDKLRHKKTFGLCITCMDDFTSKRSDTIKYRSTLSGLQYAELCHNHRDKCRNLIPFQFTEH